MPRGGKRPGAGRPKGQASAKTDQLVMTARMAGAIVVESYTRLDSIRRARATLARMVPARDWLRSAARSPEAKAAHTMVLRELGAIIGGQRPDEVHIVVRRSTALPTKKQAEEIRGA